MKAVEWIHSKNVDYVRVNKSVAIALRRPIVLHMTYGLAAEPNSRLDAAVAL